MKSVTVAERVSSDAVTKAQVWRVALRAAGVVGFAYLTALGAQIRIPLPFTPVPVTGQTLFVLLSGVCLGSVYGLSSQALYVALGIVGMPFFAGGSAGLTVLLGPTGGYLLGFVVASAIMGVAQSAKRESEVVAALLLATGTIYFLGAMHLALFLGADLQKAVLLGALPFLPGDLVKMAIVFFAWKRLIKKRRAQ
jgi:biotin transport system substrate-specific component